MAVLRPNAVAVAALLALAACGGPGDAGAGAGATEPGPPEDAVDDEVMDGSQLPPTPGPLERVDDLEVSLEPDERGFAVTARSTGRRWFAVVTLASGVTYRRDEPGRGERAERLTVLRGALPDDVDHAGDAAGGYAYEHAEGVIVGPGTAVSVPHGLPPAGGPVQLCVEVAALADGGSAEEVGREIEMPLWRERETVHVACSDFVAPAEG